MAKVKPKVGFKKRSRKRRPDGSFDRSPLWLDVVDTAQEPEPRKEAAFEIIMSALPRVARSTLIGVRSSCLEAAVAVGQKTLKEECLAVVDAALKLQRCIKPVIAAMDQQGASAELRRLFPAGDFPPVHGSGPANPDDDPLFVQTKLVAAPAVRALAATLDVAVNAIGPLHEPLRELVDGDTERKGAKELAFAKALRKHTQDDARLRPLLTGRLGYLLAISCGLVALPGELAAADRAVGAWKKRLRSGKNTPTF